MGNIYSNSGYPRRANSDSQHSEARPELWDWLWFELFTEKNYRIGPFSGYLGNNFELYSKQLFRIVPGMGGVPFLFMSCFYHGGKRETDKNKIRRKSQETARTVLGQSRDNPGAIPRKIMFTVVSKLITDRNFL